MKKRVLALLVCAMVSVNLLAGCGSDSEPAAATEEATEEVEEVEEAEEEDYEEADGMCSDEDFAALQEAYAALAEEYNLVVDFYANNDDIPQDDEVESLLADAKDYMETVGEINQSDITGENAVELADSMVLVSQGLEKCAQALGIMAGDGSADSASGEGCSDETFASLQEAYGYLTEEYNMVVEEYMNNDSIPQNADLESYLADAKDLIEEMGEIERASITEENAVTLAESMTEVANSIAEVAEAVLN